MEKHLNSICVFGAGSSGWITALALNTYLPEIPVTLVSSRKHGSIGVGESTQPDLLDLLSAANVDFNDFFYKVDCTLKHGIYYKNWNEVGKDYWHPFSKITASGEYTRAHHYRKMNILEPENYPLSDYYKVVHPTYDICINNNRSSTELVYGFHIDADKMAAYFKDFLKDRIRIVECDDYEIDSTDDQINAIICDKVQRVEADLFVDCTGFNRVLVNKVNNTEYDNYEGNVNSALFGRIQYGPDNVNVIPYTQAEAWGNGWCWTIPLQSRVGSGCVYNDQFISDEDAKTFFVDHWKGALKREDIKKVSFSSKSLKKPWKSNVVAVGLSAGFIEPLEATGISWFILSAEVLGIMLKNRYFDENLAERYNTTVRSFIEDVQDFIDVHYMLSARRDTEFWKYQTSRPRSQRLLSRLETYRKFMPNKNNRRSSVAWAFNDVSWIDILTGYNFKFENVDVPLELMKVRHNELYQNRNNRRF